MKTATIQKPKPKNKWVKTTNDEINVDENVPHLETKPQIQKQEPIIESPLEKVDTPVIKTPTIDNKLDKLLVKTAGKTKTEVTSTLISAPKEWKSHHLCTKIILR